ncbi:MAG: radical SAM protein [Elusimicrobia bacterium]|nr:radical SAM protein [Elusimicrobiota bacterium]
MNPALPLVELSLADVRKILPEDLLRRIDHIVVCGNHGDAIMAQETLEIFRYLRQANDKTLLGLHTNGSARSAGWWADLGKVLGRGGYVRFGIDGLEDTNYLYRRRTSWSLIMRNARAFIEAGGRAEWAYLVFKHNEHQVAQAGRLAAEMGFYSFTPKKTGRFFDGNLRPITRSPVKDSKGEVEYHIESPLSSEWINEAWLEAESIDRKHGGMPNYLDMTEISCKAAAAGSIYVSAEGHVLPCCWLGSDLYREKFKQSRLGVLIGEAGGMDAINAKLHSIQEIVEGPLFQRRVPESWGKKSAAEGRIPTCARVCGKEFSQYEHQFGRQHSFGGGMRALKAMAGFCRRNRLLAETTINAVDRGVSRLLRVGAKYF